MDLVTLSMLGEGDGNLFQMLALQEAAKGGVQGMAGNKMMLLPLARKFADKLAAKIRDMDDSQRARVIAALVSLNLGSRSEGEYKEILEFSGVQDLMGLLSSTPTVIDVTNYGLNTEQKVGEIGGEIRKKKIPAEEAKTMPLSDQEPEEEPKKGGIRIR